MSEYPKATQVIPDPQPTLVTITITREQADRLYHLFNVPCVCHAVPVTREVRRALAAAGVQPHSLDAHIKIRDAMVDHLRFDGVA